MKDKSMALVGAVHKLTQDQEEELRARAIEDRARIETCKDRLRQLREEYGTHYQIALHEVSSEGYPGAQP